METERYCLCCDENVPCHTVERHQREEVICSKCGFPLEVKELWDAQEQHDTVAFIAEDSDVVRRVLIDMLENKEFVQKVIPCTNGVELLKMITDTYKEKYLDKKEIRPSFAIIDLNMPLMDGLTAARSIRSLEEKNNIKKIPIVFFSSIVADEKMRSILKTLSPAVYINKGNNPDMKALLNRVDTLIKYVSEKYLK